MSIPKSNDPDSYPDQKEFCIEKRGEVCYLPITMTPERHRLPDWARRERSSDLAWISENVHVFLPAAQAAFQEQGRGAIVVDTTSRPTGAGHPFGYLPQELLKEMKDDDINRIVNDYNPEEEMVVILIKSKDRTSTYRIQPLPPPD